MGNCLIKWKRLKGGESNFKEETNKRICPTQNLSLSVLRAECETIQINVDSLLHYLSLISNGCCPHCKKMIKTSSQIELEQRHVLKTLQRKLLEHIFTFLESGNLNFSCPILNLMDAKSYATVKGAWHQKRFYESQNILAKGILNKLTQLSTQHNQNLEQSLHNYYCDSDDGESYSNNYYDINSNSNLDRLSLSQEYSPPLCLLNNYGVEMWG